MDHPNVRVDHTGDRPVIVKTAAGGTAATLLRQEILALKAAQHPGVVTFISSTDDEHGVELRTRFSGSRTLANLAPLPVDKVAGIVAALATTVADLHEMGVSHGRVSPDHVLIAADGRPVLCGLSKANIESELGDRQGDVAQLGSLLRDLVTPGDNLAPIPDTKFGRKSSWSGYLRRALLNLADQATADDPGLRPTARQLANNIRSTVPGASLLDEEGSEVFADMPYANPDEPAEPRWHWPGRQGSTPRPPWVATLGAGAAAALLVAYVAVSLLGASPPPEPSGESTVASTAAPTTTSVAPRLTTTTRPGTVEDTPTTEHPDPPAPPPGPGPGPEMTSQPTTDRFAAAAGCSTTTGNDGPTLASGTACPVEFQLTGQVLTIDDAQFHLGLTDAAVAVGDFACTGRVLAAVLDRAQGHVYLFHDWASEEQPATAQSLQQIDQGSRLLAEPGPDNCHTLVALDAFGVRHVIPTPTQESP